MKEPSPTDNLKGHTKLEDTVFDEVYYRGPATSEQIAMAVRKKMKRVTAKEVEQALRAWQKRKWLQRRQWKWFLTHAVMRYMR